MTRTLSKTKRLANKVAEINAELAKLAKLNGITLPQPAKTRRTRDLDPCANQQTAYDAAVLLAAQALLDMEDAQAAALAAQANYGQKLMLAMVALIFLQQCRAQNPP